jgi:hypothetical protein
MLYRDHRGLLADSMKTVVELPATRLALFCHLHKIGENPRKMQDVKVERYPTTGNNFDKRIGWYTFIVSVKGDAVGFTNEMPR